MMSLGDELRYRKLFEEARATQERIEAFTGWVREGLAKVYVALEFCTLGRDNTGVVWLLTMTLPNRSILTVRAPVGNDGNHATHETACDVVRRTVKYLTDNKLI